MAYEDMTYEVILSRMLDRVESKYPNLDRREGSIIFDALAPIAIELAITYVELNNALKESFVKTATREYVLTACEQMGMDISRFEASASIHKGLFDAQVPIGSRWNCDLYNYTVKSFIEMVDGKYAYALECESTGTLPNNTIGSLTPITDVPSELTYAALVECLIEGENEVSDQGVIDSYYDFVKTTVSDGNIAQYKRWCNEYDGIGNSKIIPLWNGANTVKVSILSASNKAASLELVNNFQNYIDPGVTGMGDGVAPIGAFVTVTTASEVPLNVTATVKLKKGYSEALNIDKALEDYFSTIAYEKSQVSYMSIGAVILGVEEVESISNLTINDGTKDITLGDEEIPVLGLGTWVVSNA